MARRVFYSFHYDNDNQRVQQVKNMGVVEGQPILSSNTWEEVTRGGEAAIKQYIANELKGKSCLVVLIGSSTAGRKWVKYEIEQAWNAGKAALGVHVHGLKDLAGKQSTKGKNPFADFSIGSNPLTSRSLASLVSTYDPPYSDSKSVYAYINKNLAAWVDAAVQAR